MKEALGATAPVALKTMAASFALLETYPATSGKKGMKMKQSTQK
jgi:hypothetical protein